MRKEPFGRVTLLHFFAADQRTLHKEDLPIEPPENRPS